MAGLDVGDQHGYLAPRLVDGDHLVAVNRSPRRFGLGASLDDIDPRARWVNAYPEAGQLAVPECGVYALRQELVDDVLGDVSVLRLAIAKPRWIFA